MKTNPKSQKTIVLCGIAGVLLLFFALTAGLAWELRGSLRSQVINRDGEIFMAVASAEMDRVRSANEGIFAPGADEELFEVALNTSEIKGVIGVRVFKSGDEAVGGVPLSIRRGNLDPGDEDILNERTPISRFHPELNLSDVFLLLDEEGEADVSFPVLEILIPLFSRYDETVSGYAHYFIEGTDIQQELIAVDSNILTYAGSAFLLAGLLGGGFLYWAFRRLRQVNLLLQERTRHLISANQKLNMEARTAAIGAITSHLIHGLKGPLQGIRQFVTAHSYDSESQTGKDVWQDAADTTERMQGLINEVMEVLQDRSSEFSYDVSGAEIGQLVNERVLPYAEKKQVLLKIEEEGAVDGFPVTNNRASLIILILVNLLRNAIDASKPGDSVSLRIFAENPDRLSFYVSDQGGGLPEQVREHLFQPVRSRKADGSGVGLSLCRELTRHLRGELTLAGTGPDGTVFKLSITQDS